MNKLSAEIAFHTCITWLPKSAVVSLIYNKNTTEWEVCTSIMNDRTLHLLYKQGYYNNKTLKDHYTNWTIEKIGGQK